MAQESFIGEFFNPHEIAMRLQAAMGAWSKQFESSKAGVCKSEAAAQDLAKLAQRAKAGRFAIDPTKYFYPCQCHIVANARAQQR